MESYFNELKRKLKNLSIFSKNDKAINATAPIQQTFLDHPGSIYLHGCTLTEQEFRKYLTHLYRSVSYSIKYFNPPDEQRITQAALLLNGMSDRKILAMDLDETLIHSVVSPHPYQFRLKVDGIIYSFNIRPHAIEFLIQMNQYYDIIAFTASEKSYAEAVVEQLNKRCGSNIIRNILHRNNCFKTENRITIKDLRIIKNKPLSEIVMVDNNVRGLSGQLSNCIPIIDFIDNQYDCFLKSITNLLKKLATSEDVRQILQNQLALHKILQFDRESFENPYFRQKQNWQCPQSRVFNITHSKKHLHFTGLREQSPNQSQQLPASNKLQQNSQELKIQNKALSERVTNLAVNISHKLQAYQNRLFRKKSAQY